MLGDMEVGDDGEKIASPLPAVVWLMLLDRIQPLVTVKGDHIRFKNWEVLGAVLSAIVASRRPGTGLPDTAHEMAVREHVLAPYRERVFNAFSHAADNRRCAAVLVFFFFFGGGKKGEMEGRVVLL